MTGARRVDRPVRYALDVAALAVLPLTFAAQEAVLHAAAVSFPVPGAGEVPGTPVVTANVPAGGAVVIVLLSLLQCAALARIVVAFSRSPLTVGRVAIVALTCAAMARVALDAGTPGSADMYAYVGYAIFSGNPYFPTASLPVAYHSVETLWGRPLTPCVYGPLWLAIDRFAVHGSAGLAEAIGRERLLGLAGVLALTAAARFAGATTPVAALVALHPAVWRLFVADGHNDIFAVALTVVAWGLCRRGMLGVALLPIVLAASWKISFLLVGLAAIAARPPVIRLAAVILSVGLSLAASWIWGGRAYFDAVWNTGHSNAAGGILGILHIAAGAIVVVALLGAALGQWVTPAVTMLIPTVAANLYGWYFLWPVPYALRARCAQMYLTLLPLAATLGIYSKWVGYGVLLLLILLAESGRRIAPPPGGSRNILARAASVLSADRPSQSPRIRRSATGEG